MHRFFLPGELTGQDRVSLKGEQAHQVSHVLRLKPKDHILVVGNDGWEYEVEIEESAAELVRGRVIRKTLCTNEPGIKITLFQALLKTDKFEFVLQKGVELGVSAFVPITTFATPEVKRSFIVFSSRMPPPTSIFASVLFAISFIMLKFFNSPSIAPSRSTTCMKSAP